MSAAEPRCLDLLLCDGYALKRAIESWHMGLADERLLAFTWGRDLFERVLKVSPSASASLRLAFIDYIVEDPVPSEEIVTQLISIGARVVAISNSDEWNQRLLAAGAQEAVPSVQLLRRGELPLG